MCALLHSPAVDLVGDVRFGSKADIAALNLDVRLPPVADIGGASRIWLPVYESARPVNSLIQLLDSLAKVINERLQSHMKMITLMLSAVIIYPCHQFFRAFSFRHVGPLRR